MMPEAEKHVLDQYFKRKIDGVILCELYGGIGYIEPFLKVVDTRPYLLIIT